MGETRKITIHPATAARWRDVETLFGDRGACGGCWCMWARLPRAEYVRGKGAGNRRALRRLVGSGTPPGLLAYVNGAPAAWLALAPRADYRRLETSHVLAPVDEQPVWSVSCFFVSREHRRLGLSVRLLEEAARFAARSGARILEGYPVDTRGRTSPDAFVWTGLLGTFRAAGFTEVARRSPSRPIMRRTLRAAARVRAVATTKRRRPATAERPRVAATAKRPRSAMAKDPSAGATAKRQRRKPARG